MAALAMDYSREPEMARFIDTHKFDQDMSTKRDKFGGGTSLPLNSDGYENKQQQLRDERHIDWMRQQEKQKESEKQKFEARRQAQPTGAPAAGPQIDYDRNNEMAKQEDRKAYQDYMKAKEERYWAMRGRPVTPPGGLNIGSYERHQKETAEQKKKEYKEMLDQQTAEQLRMKAFERVAEVSPGHINYREDERPLVGSPRDVNYYLHEQQREHMYLKARQEPEVAVMDRSGVREQYLASKPPAGPGFRPRDEPTKQNPAFWNDGHRSRGPMSLDSNVPRSNMSSSSKLGTPLAFKTSEPQNRRPIPERPRHGQPPYHGERENDAEKVVYKAVDQVEPQGQEPRQGQGHPPQGQFQRGPGNLYSDEKTRTPPEWLKNDAYSNSLQRPVDSNQSVIGTPLAFKTPYRPIQQHPARPSPLPDNSYSQNQRPIYNELDPTSQRARSRGSPDQGRGSRRSYEAERRPGGQGQEEMNDKSPRRKKQSLYNDNEDVLAKRDKANKERQEEYNEYIKMKQNEERRRQEETRQPVGKPAERVRSPHYSSDDYESWRRKEQQKLGKEYQDYLKEQYNPKASEGLPLGQYKYEPKRLAMEQERNKEYNDMLQKRGGHIPNPIDAPVTGPQGLNIDVSFQPKKQAWLEKERNRDYNEFLKKRTFREKIPTPPNLQGLPIGQNRYEPMHKAMEYQRNKEYNEFIQKKGHDNRNRDWNFEQNGILELRGDDANQSRQRELRAERQKDYNDYKTQMKPAPNHDWPTPNYEKPFITRGAYDGLKELYDEERRKDLQDALERRREHKSQSPGRRHDFVDTAQGPYNGGLFQGLGQRGPDKDGLNQQRKHEYNERLDQNVDRGRSPQRNPGPGGADQYSRMLEEKRREEASRRRFDDPEFQGRLPQSRERDRYGF